MSEETKKEAPAADKPAATQAPVELTVQDLGVLRSIIDVASQRGAFKANEMEAVGKTFNKLDTFLNTVAKAEEEAKAKSTTAEKATEQGAK